MSSASEVTPHRILGVDPSLNRTGWAILTPGVRTVIATGIIAPSPSARGDRLLSIRASFEEVLDCWNPAAAYFEAPGTWRRRGGIRSDTIEAMAMARAVMITTCAEFGIDEIQVDFREARRRLVGNANAGSDQILHFLLDTGWTVPSRPRGGPDLDIANAILLGLFGLYDADRTTSSDGRQLTLMQENREA